MNISIWLTIILLFVRSLISVADIKSMWEAGQVFELLYNIVGFVGESIGATALIMAIFNKWAWKWRYIRKIHNMPVLSKKYSGSFTSDYEGKKQDGMIIIDQTFLTISIQIKTNESCSRSFTASFCDVYGMRYLIYTYQNDPRAEIQDRSPIHYGTAMLDVNNPELLEGNYFTGRKTKGSMRFIPA